MIINNITHLLLDLDGTLLHFDQEVFVSRYLELIRVHFQDHQKASMIPAWILEGTEKMLQNEGVLTNREVFLRYFSEKSGLSYEDIWHRFMRFYQTEFNQLEDIIVQNPEALKFLEAAQKKGFSLIIATQPVFPEIAIRQRLRWAGLAHFKFRLITDINMMRSCKPRPSYFRQITEMLAVEPAACLMIGDDPVNDMASSKAGIANFYIGDGPGRAGDFKILAELLQIPW